MALSEDRLQQILANKDVENAEYGECWQIIDGALVIFQEDAVPDWLPSDEERTENGNTVAWAKKHGDTSPMAATGLPYE